MSSVSEDLKFVDEFGITTVITCALDSVSGQMITVDPVKMTMERFDGIFVLASDTRDVPDQTVLPFSGMEAFYGMPPVPEGSTFRVIRRGRTHLYVWTDDHWQRVRVKDGVPIRD